jgi:hypothetical protein
MFTTVTIRMQAESRAELIDTFASQIKKHRKQFELLRTEGAFGPPENVELRYLVIGSTWRGEAPKEIEDADNG